MKDSTIVSSMIYTTFLIILIIGISFQNSPLVGVSIVGLVFAYIIINNGGLKYLNKK